MKKLLFFIAFSTLINATVQCMQKQTITIAEPEKVDSSTVLESFDKQSRTVVAGINSCFFIAIRPNQINFDTYHNDLKEKIDKLYELYLLNKKVSSIVSRSPRYNTLIFKAQRIKNKLTEYNNEDTEAARHLITDTISGLLQSLHEAQEKNKPKSKL